MSIADIVADPQYRARGNLMDVEDPRIGPLLLPTPLPRMSATPPAFRGTAPALGSGNAAVLGGLFGLDAATLDDLAARAVI